MNEDKIVALLDEYEVLAERTDNADLTMLVFQLRAVLSSTSCGAPGAAAPHRPA